MIVDFGETFYSDNYQVRDTAGDLQNAGTVTATLTLPDGTTTTPTVANPSTGVYNFKYTTAQAGLHRVVVSATGGVLASDTLKWVDAFDVRDAVPGYIVSLTDVHAHMNMSAATTAAERARDEELRRLIETATERIEEVVGPVVVRTITNERHADGRVLMLQNRPVVSLTSVVPWLTSGITYDVAGLTFDAASGFVERDDGGWFTGGPFAVTYKAGRPVIPSSFTEAALELVRINFRSQLGGNFSEFDTGTAEGVVDLGFFMPRGVLGLLTEKRGPLVA